MRNEAIFSASLFVDTYICINKKYIVPIKIELSKKNPTVAHQATKYFGITITL